MGIRFVFYVLFSLTSHILAKDPGPNRGRIVCNGTKVKELDDCWTIPRMTNKGNLSTPSSPHSIQRACRVLESGIQCVRDWTATCLSSQNQEKLQGSVAGALETYKLLCTNGKPQENFLTYADCYTRVSPLWDKCTKTLINDLKGVQDGKDLFTLCCIRTRYMTCLNHAGNSICPTNAAELLITVAKPLMQSTVSAYYFSRCNEVDLRNCVIASSAKSFFTTVAHFHVLFCELFLLFYTDIYHDLVALFIS